MGSTNGKNDECASLVRTTVESAEKIGSFAVDAFNGGLILIGPDACVMDGLESLIASPDLEPVVARSEMLLDWRTVAGEVVSISRLASRLIRKGRTPVIYLDSHLADGPSVPAELRDFVCRRMSQILIGLAEAPAYVAVHGDQMVQTLIIESLGDTDVTSVGRLGDEFPLWKLSDNTMFGGLPFALCPANHATTGVAQLHQWFEGRRNRQELIASI